VLPVLSRLRAIPHAPQLRGAGDGADYPLDSMLPAASVHELEQRLPALTRGEGVLESSFDHYQPVTGPVPERPRTDDDPLNRKEYLLRVERRVLRPSELTQTRSICIRWHSCWSCRAADVPPGGRGSQRSRAACPARPHPRSGRPSGRPRIATPEPEPVTGSAEPAAAVPPGGRGSQRVPGRRQPVADAGSGRPSGRDGVTPAPSGRRVGFVVAGAARVIGAGRRGAHRG
jgi:hypothetical protein